MLLKAEQIPARTGEPVEIIAVVGPTASGKTAVAVALAERLDTEILSADSMQVYRGMAIGTGAPSQEELARAKHHFIGFLEPFEEFSAGRFEELARPHVARLNAAGRPAVVVGGSGLYVTALVDGLFPGPGRNAKVRARLHREAEEEGVAVLYARLERVDPDYAAAIQCNDLRRIVRAIEVHEVAGEPLSKLHREHRAGAEGCCAIQVALDWPREQLYDRINRRVDAMLDAGLIDEVRALVEAGYGAQIERLRSLGYREMAAHLRGELSLDEAVELMKRSTRRYAKRQLSWFRGDPRVQWLPAPSCSPEALAADIATRVVH